MGKAAVELLATFEKLDPTERQEVAAEILRRAAGKDELSEKGYEELGAAVFEIYDAEEGERAKD